MRLMIELILKLSLILCGLLTLSSPAIGSSCASGCSAPEFGLGVPGGSAFKVLKSDSRSYRARGGVVASSTELDIGYSPDSSHGMFGALSFQALGMEPLYSDSIEPAGTSELEQSWNGGGLGIKLVNCSTLLHPALVPAVAVLRSH